ncbi:MAG: glycosyltransferase family 4 protein [Cyanophyceae cyanobacterium]
MKQRSPHSKTAPSPLNRPKKISILVSDFSQESVGRWGGSVRTFILAEALETLGYDVELVGANFGDHYPALEAMGRRWSLKVEPGTRYPSFFKSAWRISNHVDGDIIYAHKLKPSSFGIALLQKWFKGKPVILDIDDWEMSWHKGDNFRYRVRPMKLLRDLFGKDGWLQDPNHPLYMSWTEKLVSQATQVTVNTEALQQRFGGALVPSGKDMSAFDPTLHNGEASRAHYGLSDYKVLMFPGAPRAYKGVEDILEAMKILGWRDLRLVIVGGSPYDRYDQELQKNWGESYLIQLPKQPPEKMPQVVSAAHVVVVPQRDTAATRAQFPLKLTDGMAMAKPILTTQVGDIPSILGDAGYIVEPESPRSLAAALESIFANYPEAEERGRQARQRCLENFSLGAIAGHLQSIFEAY